MQADPEIEGHGAAEDLAEELAKGFRLGEAAHDFIHEEAEGPRVVALAHAGFPQWGLTLQRLHDGFEVVNRHAFVQGAQTGGV